VGIGRLLKGTDCGKRVVFYERNETCFG